MGRGRPRSCREGARCKANAVAVRGGMQGDVDGGVSGVGEKGALVEGEVRVGIAEDEGGDAAILKFLAQTASEGDGDVFLGERVAESFATVVAAVAGVDYSEITARDGSRLIGCRLLGGRITGRWNGGC